MRLALVSLIALAGAASAYAQTSDQAPPASPPSPPSAAPMATPPPPAPTAAPVATTASPSPPAAPPAAASPDTSQAPPTTAAAPPTAAVPTAPPPTPSVEQAPPAPPPPPPAPPPAPTPPTDPTAIALLNVLQHICMPAANGGNLPQLAKAAGFRKNSDNNWTAKTRDYSITVEDPGSNPNQCHVDVMHPVDLESPGRPIIIALNDYVGIENGWSLYRNDKNVQGGTQFTTRSWQHSTDTTAESLVFATMRKPDGTPLRGGLDTSQMIYDVEKVSN